ncbi:MAG: L-lactate permease [Planctomycetaceae bacterium]
MASAARPISLPLAWTPYVLTGLLLVLTRLPALGIADLLKGFKIDLPDFGTGIGISSTPLYLPGTIFVVVALLTALLHRMRAGDVAAAWRQSGRTIVRASLALMFTVPMVQVILLSANGAAGYAAMPLELARGAESLAGRYWPVGAPWMGGLGAAVAGSNTVSNMMFALFQYDVGVRIGADPLWIVALQAVGGAAGNMICVHNVVAASAVVGMVGREGAVIRKTLIPFTYYVLAAGLLGLAIAG